MLDTSHIVLQLGKNSYGLLFLGKGNAVTCKHINTETLKFEKGDDLIVYPVLLKSYVTAVDESYKMTKLWNTVSTIRGGASIGFVSNKVVVVDCINCVHMECVYSSSNLEFNINELALEVRTPL